MRFRAKFGAEDKFIAAVGILSLLMLFISRHPSVVMAVVLTLLALQRLLGFVFVYWEVNSDSLIERRLWTTKEIAWEQVTHVGGLGGRASASSLEVDFARSAPMSDRGHILANPEDRQQFISELRRFAPQATFDV